MDAASIIAHSHLPVVISAALEFVGKLDSKSAAEDNLAKSLIVPRPDVLIVDIEVHSSKASVGGIVCVGR